MFLALVTLGIVFAVFFHCFRHNKGRLDCQAPGTVDEIVSVQKPKSVIKPLLAHVGKDFGFRWEQNPAYPVNIVLGKFYARVRNVYLQIIKCYSFEFAN